MGRKRDCVQTCYRRIMAAKISGRATLKPEERGFRNWSLTDWVVCRIKKWLGDWTGPKVRITSRTRLHAAKL